MARFTAMVDFPDTSLATGNGDDVRDPGDLLLQRPQIALEPW